MTELVVDVSKKKKIRKIRGSLDGDLVLLKVNLPSVLTQAVRSALNELKNRGATISVEELLSEFLSEMPENYLEEQITKNTPEDYYLEEAKKNPELRQKLILMAKRALSAPKKTIHPPKRKQSQVDASAASSIHLESCS